MISQHSNFVIFLSLPITLYIDNKQFEKVNKPCDNQQSRNVTALI